MVGTAPFLFTFSSSAALSWGAISSTLRSWSSKTAAHILGHAFSGGPAPQKGLYPRLVCRYDAGIAALAIRKVLVDASLGISLTDDIANGSRWSHLPGSRPLNPNRKHLGSLECRRRGRGVGVPVSPFLES
jgi:hypothetical protein